MNKAWKEDDISCPKRQFGIDKERTMAKKKFYAVQNGRVPGVYLTWDECKKQVDGYSGASYKSFPTREEAENYVKGGAGNGKSPEAAAETPTVAPKEAAAEMTVGTPASVEQTCKHKHEEEPEAVAYVDGSYYHGSGRFSCGVVLFWNGKELHFKEAYSDPELAAMRNVAGEIKGAELAMKYCLEHEIASLRICHDYEGIAKWCEGQWEAKKEGTRAYRDFYRSASEKVKITFRKVKGHSGDTWNDLADHLAKEALGLV